VVRFPTQKRTPNMGVTEEQGKPGPRPGVRVLKHGPRPKIHTKFSSKSTGTRERPLRRQRTTVGGKCGGDGVEREGTFLREKHTFKKG